MDLELYSLIIPLVIIPTIIIAYAARSKGYSTFLWFIYGLVSWPVALLNLLVLADFEKIIEGRIRSKEIKQCSHCKKMIDRHAKVCPFCDSNVGAVWVSANIPEIEKSVSYPQGPGTAGVDVYTFAGKEYPSRDIAEHARTRYIASLKAQQAGD